LRRTRTSFAACRKRRGAFGERRTCAPPLHLKRTTAVHTCRTPCLRTRTPNTTAAAALPPRTLLAGWRSPSAPTRRWRIFATARLPLPLPERRKTQHGMPPPSGDATTCRAHYQNLPYSTPPAADVTFVQVHAATGCVYRRWTPPQPHCPTIPTPPPLPSRADVVITTVKVVADPYVLAHYSSYFPAIQHQDRCHFRVFVGLVWLRMDNFFWFWLLLTFHTVRAIVLHFTHNSFWFPIHTHTGPFTLCVIFNGSNSGPSRMLDRYNKRGDGR